MPSSGNNGAGPPKLRSPRSPNSLPRRRPEPALEPAAPAVIHKLQGGRPSHHPDRQHPERPGGGDMTNQPGEVHPQEAGDERQRQGEGGGNPPPPGPQVGAGPEG